jgi:5,10-methylenetetrahydromethanopterin reductase
VHVSCAFPPGPEVVEHAVLAESLGYERAWLYDSPALYPDVWVTLARVAERTERI